jgi:protein tyrosine phosphatase (PTP) superfamily phosphohydrolase (DUF442 family)
MSVELEDIFNWVILGDDLATAGQPGADELAAVARAGYQTVINLALPTSDNALADERAVVEGLGLEYVAIPVQFDAPTLDDLLCFLDAMDRRVGRRLFVHCAANMRVSVFVALWRVLRLGWEPARAMADVHRIWRPDCTWSAFLRDALARGRDRQ